MLIGEISRRSGVSARMLRHYESLGLVRPAGRTGSGYRQYSEEDLWRIFHIECLHSLGMSLREIGRALDDPRFTPSSFVSDLIQRTSERIEAETELLHRLQRLNAADPADWQDAFQIVALLQALGSPDADARQRAALSSGGGLPVPVEALVEAVLKETEPNVAGVLRWALARSADDAVPALVATGLGAAAAEVRERAVRCLAAIPGGEVTVHLSGALTDPDAGVRGHAALALGARAVADAIPELVDMVAVGRHDTDAADALGALAIDTATADRIATGLVQRLADVTTDARARGRLTQALADIPGPMAAQTLVDLSQDADRAVALTAAYLCQLRDTQ
jgi:DNA-binding transcriptional MerR regulator